jgi:hypothetical protein
MSEYWKIKSEVNKEVFSGIRFLSPYTPRFIYVRVRSSAPCSRIVVALSLKSTEDVCESVFGYKSTGRRRRHGDTLFCWVAAVLLLSRLL